MAFNSKQYAWIDSTVVIGGRVVTGIRGISYSEKTEKEFVYGKGGNPLSIQEKNTSYEGEITLLQSELEALIDSSPTKKLKDVVMDSITFSYGAGSNLITDQILQVEFTETKKELKQGDGFMEVSLPIMFLELKNQV